jgi:hypothetical protein
MEEEIRCTSVILSAVVTFQMIVSGYEIDLSLRNRTNSQFTTALSQSGVPTE